jgi:hypothetical protein
VQVVDHVAQTELNSIALLSVNCYRGLNEKGINKNLFTSPLYLRAPPDFRLSLACIESASLLETGVAGSIERLALDPALTGEL